MLPGQHTLVDRDLFPGFDTPDVLRRFGGLVPEPDVDLFFEGFLYKETTYIITLWTNSS